MQTQLKERTEKERLMKHREEYYRQLRNDIKRLNNLKKEKIIEYRLNVSSIDNELERIERNEKHGKNNDKHR